VASAALTFSDVSKRFPDGTVALTDVDLAVRPGEFVSIVGPSGCGKSTLLRIASGLTSASSGKVEVDRAHIGYVFQDATLLPWRTVKANVELPGELSGVPKADRVARAAAAIQLVGLDGFAKHRPHELSGGMKMRASLARALTMEPKVFLFDEPFGALDEITRERLNDELIKLFAAQSFAGLFITHSVNEAVFLSTRVVVMSRRPGRLIGEVEVPFEYPRSPELRFTPEFTHVAGEVSALLRSAEAGEPSISVPPQSNRLAAVGE
jgi:NitT/TauT family transport system ATP-binding protein